MASLRCLANVSGALGRSVFRHAHRGMAEQRYVRVAGVAACAGREDFLYFMQRNGVDTSRITAISEKTWRDPVGHDWGPVPLSDPREHSRRPAHGDDATRNAPAVTEASERTQTESQEKPEAKLEEQESKSPAVEVAGNDQDEQADELASESAAASDTVDEDPVGPLLAQGAYDNFINHAVWVYDAGSESAAREASAKLSGKLCGMKLVRAAAVDENIVTDMLGTRDGLPGKSKSKRRPRSRLQIISPGPEERDRAVLILGLPNFITARYLWSFFGMYDVVALRYLRRDKLASVVFRTPEEARRAVRERSNLPIHEHPRITLKMHT